MKVSYQGLLWFCVLIWCSANAYSTVLYVKPNAVSNAWPNQSNVYYDLQQALSDALDGDEIWVSAGTYLPTSTTDRTISFELKAGVKMYGGFDGTETALEERNWRANETILSGNIGEALVETDNSYHVLLSNIGYAATTHIDGFTITGSHSEEVGENREHSGGGLISFSGTVQIFNCKFDHNYTYWSGSGVFLTAGKAQIYNTIFSNNSTNGYGGGVSAYSAALDMVNCVFYKNTALAGNACVVARNSTDFSFVNIIDWDNYPSGETDNFTYRCSYSCVQGTSWQAGSIKADPQFIDAEGGDFRLRANSPCINSGDNGVITENLGLDYYGNHRIQDGIVDMGVYEGTGIICPVNVSPANDQVYRAGSGPVEVEFSAGWSDGNPDYTISEYYLEYWGEDGVKKQLQLDATMRTSVYLSARNSYKWRIYVVDESGSRYYSRAHTVYVINDTPIYVKPDGAGDGSSWSQAYGTLSEALIKAYKGENIWVAAGTYYPTAEANRMISFDVSGKRIYGGFTGDESALNERDWVTNPTVLSGNIGNPELATDNTFTLMYCSQQGADTTVIDGLIVKDGYSNYYSGHFMDGGALYAAGGVVYIRNSRFEDNFASDDGGAMYFDEVTAVISNTIMTNNKSNDDGGVIYSYSSSLSIVNSLVYGNHSGYWGGFMYRSGGTLSVANSILWENSAQQGYDNVNAGSSGNISYSCMKDAGGEGCVNADPLFVAPDKGDFRLNAASPCINVGSNSKVPETLTEDFNGHNRIADDIVDMGIYEGAGVICPVNQLPGDQTVLRSNEEVLSLHFEASWGELVPDYSIAATVVEYSGKDGEWHQVEIDESLNFNLELAVGDVYQWRIGVQTETGMLNYSPVTEFVLGFDRPVYVKEGGSGDGSSWEQAYGTVYDALENAIWGDELWIAKGTYYATGGTDRSQSFTLKTKVSLYGGFSGSETELEDRDYVLNPTILSGNIGDEAVNTDNTSNVLYVETSDTVVVDGITIQDGYARYNRSRGGAVYHEAGFLNLINCVLSDNYALNGGAAIYMSKGRMALSNTLVDKHAGGPAVFYMSKGEMALNNVTLTQNSVSGHLITGAFSMSNSIVWGNNKPLALNYNGIALAHSIIEGYKGSVETVYNQDPVFMNAAEGDYRLHISSIGIDAAANDSLPASITHDLQGLDRIQNGTVDMGAFEGGVITPALMSPGNGEIIKAESENQKVTFQWEWNATVAVPEVLSYTLQLWINDEEVMSIEGIEALQYDYSLPSGSTVRWRVDARLSDDSVIRSYHNTFNITHNHPIYVSTDGTGDGSSWSSALGLTEALSIALDGDEIWMAKGTYYPSESDATVYFRLNNQVSIYGGFAGSESALSERELSTNETILSGNIGDVDDNTDNSNHVLWVTGDRKDTVLLDHLTIEGGYAYSGNTQGAGLFVQSGFVHLHNSKVAHNSSNSYGAGVYVEENAGAQMVNVILIGNQGNYYGGAIYNKGNLKVINSLLYNNSTRYYGGAIYSNNSDCTVYNSILWNNTAGYGQADFERSKVYHSCMKGASGNGNLSSDPLFNDPENEDFRLNALSPCVNAGNNEYYTVDGSDIRGQERIQGETIDMGPFEGGVHAPVIVSPVAGEIVKGGFLGTEVMVTWNWAEDVEQLENAVYRIEYRRGEGSVTSIDVANVNSTVLNLSNGNNYNLRVAYIDDNGLPCWSEPVTFSLTHEFAIKVKTGGSGNGSSWDRAFGDLNKAIQYAVAGDEIWIAGGTYKASADDNRLVAFEVDKTLSIYGGFKGNEIYFSDRNIDGNETILSGDIGVEGDSGDNTYQLMRIAFTEKDSLVLDGVVISGANAINSIYSDYEDGAGMYISKGKVTVNNCKFIDNHADWGGAIYAQNARVDLYNSLVVKNKSQYRGGAVAAKSSTVNVINSTVTANVSAYLSASFFESNQSANINVYNSIVWANHVDGSETDSQPMYSAVYSCADLNGSSEGVIKADPLFVDPENGNYRLKSGSPCINSGLNDSISHPDFTDLDGYGRVRYAKVDMGCYEAAYPTLVFPQPDTPVKPSNGGFMMYTWGLGADINGVEPDPMGSTYIDYKIKFLVWDKEDPTNIYHEQSLKSLSTYVMNMDYAKGYEWKVGVVTGGYTYWSDAGTFYIGREAPVYVKEGANGDGSSWESAFGTLTEALEITIPGDEVWVARGTYTPSNTGDREATFKVGSYVALYGGFAGNETRRSGRYNNDSVVETVLSGDIGTIGDKSDNTKHIITMERTADESLKGIRIDGFTIRDANAGSESGGAIKTYMAQYKLYDCKVLDNTAAKGAAIYNLYADPYIYNSLFSGNSSEEGIIYSDVKSNPAIINTTIAGNDNGVYGGGTIVNTIIYGNTDSQIKGGTPQVSYSCIEGGYEGTGIVEYDPDFNDPAAGDYTLGLFSSCFDKGNDEVLPNDAFLDLFKNESRSFYSAVDIGAFEIGVFQRGIVEVVSGSPENGAAGVDYDAVIKLVFNVGVEVMNPELISASGNNPVVEYTVEGNELSLIFARPFEFESNTVVEMASGAVRFKNNEKIPVMAHSMSFGIRSCAPVSISAKQTELDLCLFSDTILDVSLSGDYLSVYNWKFEGEPLGVISKAIEIPAFDASKAGVYTIEVSDRCGNTEVLDIEARLKETTPVNIMDKWNNMLFIDNGDKQLRDFSWYVNGSFTTDKQYLELKQVTAQVYATAMDTRSGCMVYSDTISIANGGLKSISVNPNPVAVSHTLFINLAGQAREVEVRLYSLSGAMVSRKIYLNTAQVAFDGTNVQAGVYIVEIIADGAVEKRKLVIQN